jgi:hypothetical protein
MKGMMSSPPRRLAGLVPAVFLAGALRLGAQPPAPAPETFGSSIDVRVVNVEAVVTGRGGQRVSGLTAKDFRLRVGAARHRPRAHRADRCRLRRADAVPDAPVHLAPEPVVSTDGTAHFKVSFLLAKGSQRLVFTLRDPVSGAMIWGETRLQL